jgi:multicomponent Na+:H+ antiporter subunit C
VTTTLTRMVARGLLAPILVVAAAILVKGYADVGDGFAAGVVAALGVLLQILAFGREEVAAALPLRHAPIGRAGRRRRVPRGRSRSRSSSATRRSSTVRARAARSRTSARWSSSGPGLRHRRLPAGARRLRGDHRRADHAERSGGRPVNLVFAIVVGTLMGSGVYLLLKPDLFRVVAGIVLVSNAANLTLMGSGLTRGQAPILPADGKEPVADPLVQAMTLTALVIGFAVTAVLLALTFGVYRSRRSVDLDDLSRAEADSAAADEAHEAAHDEERRRQADHDPDEALV